MGMGKGRGMGMGMGRVWNGKAGQGMDKAGLGKGSDRRSDSQQLTSRMDQRTRVRAEQPEQVRVLWVRPALMSVNAHQLSPR